MEAYNMGYLAQDKSYNTPPNTNDVVSSGLLTQSGVMPPAAASPGMAPQASPNAAGFSKDNSSFLNQQPVQAAPLPKDIDPKDIDANWLKGYFEAKQNKREEQNQSIKNQEAINKQTEFNRQQNLTNGMSQAASTGGYSGVIDYLKVADPQRALAYSKAKNDLDTDMMKTDLMSYLLPTEKAKALAEGYQVLGKMGNTVLQQKDPDQQQALYSHMLPIIKAVNPNAPDEYNTDAAHMFMLGAAQADPNNNVFISQKTLSVSNTAVDQLDRSIKTRIAAGETPDKSPALAAEQAQMGNYVTQAATAKAALDKHANDALHMQGQNAKNATEALQAKYKLAESVADSYRKNTKAWTDLSPTLDKADVALRLYKTNPNDPAAQLGLIQSIGLMYSRGKLNPAPGSQYQMLDSTSNEALKKLMNYQVYLNQDGSPKVDEKGQPVAMPRVFLRGDEAQHITSSLQAIKNSWLQKVGMEDQNTKAIAKGYNFDATQLKQIPFHGDQQNAIDINNDFDAAIKQAGGNPQAIQQLEQKRQEYLGKISGNQAENQ